MMTPERAHPVELPHARAALSASVINASARSGLYEARALSSKSGVSFRVTSLGDNAIARTVGDTGPFVWRLIF
jgi:hypothetical protein